MDTHIIRQSLQVAPTTTMSKRPISAGQIVPSSGLQMLNFMGLPAQ
jgi:hypothetical protein